MKTRLVNILIMAMFAFGVFGYESIDVKVDDYSIDGGETGWVSGGILAKTSPDSANIEISTEMVVKVVNRTTRVVKYETIPAGTIIPTGMGPNELKYVFADLSTGSLTYKWITAPTGADRRKYAQFGRAWMDGAGNVTGVGDYVDPAWDVGESFKTTMHLSSICRVSSGNTYNLHDTNMTMKKTSGSDFRMSVYAKEYIAGTNPSPNEGPEAAVSEFTSMIMMRRDLSTLDHITAIPTTQYELDGVLTDLGNAKYGYILVFHAVKSNLCLLQHGDAEYGSLQAAIDGFNAAEYTYSPVVKNALICKGLIAFKKGVSSPTSSDISFTSLNFVPGIGGAGGAAGGTPSVDAEHLVYVGKHGNDINSGLTRDKAFLTFGAAKTYMDSQSLSSSNRFVAYCEDAGNYTESLTWSSWTGVLAPAALFSGNQILTDDSALHAFRLLCHSGDALSKTTGTGTAVAKVPRLIATGTANGMVCSSGSFTIEGGSIQVENGSAIKHESLTGVMYTDVPHIEITGLGNGIHVSGSGKVRHSGVSITDTGNGTAYSGHQNGDIDSSCSMVSCATLVNVQDSGVSLHIDSPHLQGTIVNPGGGTIRYSSVNMGMDVDGDALLRDNLSVEGNIDISTGSYYKYNGENFAMADTAKKNYFTGGAGNLTMTGTGNTGNGWHVLLDNTSGSYNTAVGYTALANNTEGNYNTASGRLSMNQNTTGSNNEASGHYTLAGNISGSQNLAIGAHAGRYIADGSTSRTNGDYGVFIGCGTRASANNVDYETVIGCDAIGSGANTITVGSTNNVNTVLRGQLDSPGVYTETTSELPNVRVHTDGSLQRSTATAATTIYNANGTIPHGRTCAMGGSLSFGTSDLLRLDNTIAAVGTRTATLYSNGFTAGGASPHFYWFDEGVGTSAGQRLWDFLAHENIMRFRAVNDANTLAESFLDVRRTSFAIDSSTFPNGNVIVNEFTKLGSDAPAIRMKKLTGTTAAAEGGSRNIAHGLTSSKILKVDVRIEFIAGQYISVGYEYNAEYHADVQWDGTNITIANHTTSSGNILSKPLVLLITYEE